MNKREIFNFLRSWVIKFARPTLNFLTGLCAFIVWIWLSYYNPEHTLNLALACLMMLLGFGGRDTIIEIVKSFRDI